MPLYGNLLPLFFHCQPDKWKKGALKEDCEGPIYLKKKQQQLKSGSFCLLTQQNHFVEEINRHASDNGWIS